MDSRSIAPSESLEPDAGLIHLIDVSADAEDALRFFAPEKPERSDSFPNRLIERQPVPPIVRVDSARSAASPTFHFGDRSRQRRSPWPARSTRVWDSVVFVSVAGVAIFVVALAWGPSAADAVSRSILGAMAVELPVVNPPPAPWQVADVPSTPGLEANVDRPRPGRDTTAGRAVSTHGAGPSVTTPAATSVASPTSYSRPRATVVTASPGRDAAPAAPAVIRSDADAIHAVVGRYLNAFRDLDVEEAKSVWPGVNERALRRVFASLDEQQVELNDCNINVAGGKAGASCTGVVRYVPKVGSKTMFVQRRRWTFELRNRGSYWLIENVETR